MRLDPDHDLVPAHGFEVRLEDAVKYALAIGAALVLLLPAARGFSETVGWLPLWLLGMPATALWALRGFPLPETARTGRTVARARRGRVGPQARRRAPGIARRVRTRAA